MTASDDRLRVRAQRSHFERDRSDGIQYLPRVCVGFVTIEIDEKYIRPVTHARGPGLDTGQTDAMRIERLQYSQQGAWLITH